MSLKQRYLQKYPQKYFNKPFKHVILLLLRHYGYS
jgi:hypothetical protein